MSFFYMREPGSEGQILTDEGSGSGAPLSDILDQGPIPIKAGLELIASLADILSIAQEDGELHGDIKPGFVRVDEKGAISVDGYGTPRRGGRAPEGRPVGTPTDIYGVGVILHACLSSESLGLIPREPHAHDQAILEKIQSIDWQILNEQAWGEGLKSFLSTTLKHSPDQRPQPLDVANVLFQAIGQLPGESLAEWATHYFQEQGSNNTPNIEDDEEDLGGPTTLNSQISSSNFRTAASAKGESTAFWSREKITAMLAGEEEASVVKPADGVGVRQTWSPNQDPPPAETEVDPPPPTVDRVEPARQPAANPTNPTAPDPVPNKPAWRPNQPIAVSNTPVKRTEPSQPADNEGGGKLKIVLIAALIAILLCGFLSVIIGGAYFVLGQGQAEMGATSDNDVAEVTAAPEAPEAAPPPTTEELPATGVTDATDVEAEPPAAAEPAPAPEPTPEPAAAPAPAPAPRPAPRPAPTVASSGPMSVKFISQGAEALLECGDGQTRSFVGSTQIEFDSITTCRVSISGTMGVVQVNTSGTIQCAATGDSVTCSPQ